MANNFPPGGALFNNNKKQNEKSPDVQGNLSISEEVLHHLNTCRQKGEEMKMDIAGWRKAMKSGGTFYSLVAKIPWQAQKNAGQPLTKGVGDQSRARPRSSDLDLDEEIPF